MPGEGTHRLSHDDPRMMEAVPPGEVGDWILLGSEGRNPDGSYALTVTDPETGTVLEEGRDYAIGKNAAGEDVLTRLSDSVPGEVMTVTRGLATGDVS